MTDRLQLEKLKAVVQKNLKRTGCREKGRILLSPALTLRRGPLYLVGLNPGRKSWSKKKEESALVDNLVSKGDCHAYTCEQWSPRHLAGSDALQLRARWLCSEIGFDIRMVCASNLSFVRSKDAFSSEWRDDL